MTRSETRIDARAFFAAFALHKLLAGMDDPEEHFSQLEDSYSDVCEQAWRISDRMMAAAQSTSGGTETSEAFEANAGG